MSTLDNVIEKMNQKNVSIEKKWDCSLLKPTTLFLLVVGIVLTVGTMAVIGVSAVVTTAKRYPPPPLAFKDSIKGHKNEDLVVFPLKNDIDPRGLKLFISEFTNGTCGKVIQKDASTLIYRSNVGISHIFSDMFTYKVSNGYAESKSSVTVFFINRPPFCPTLYYNISTDEILYFSPMDYTNDPIWDADNDTLHVNMSQAKNGNRFIYEPPRRYKGLVELDYSVSDGIDKCSGLVLIRILNKPPVAQNDSYQIFKNQIFVLDVLKNDYDEDGQNFTIFRIFPPTMGNVEILDKKSIIYYPVITGPNTNVSFSYSIVDEEGFESIVWVVIQVVNRKPVFSNHTFLIPKNSEWKELNLVYNDPDEFDTLILTCLQPKFGQISVLAESKWVEVEYLNLNVVIQNITSYRLFYKPLLFSSYDEILEACVIDTGNLKTCAPLLIQVGNLPPSAQNKTIQNSRGKTQYEFMLDSSLDLDGDHLQLIKVEAKWGQASVWNSTHMMYSSNLSKSIFQNQNFDLVEYTISDGQAHSSAWVRVQWFNEPPIAVSDHFQIQKGKPTCLPVLLNDTDPNQDLIFIHQVFSSKQNAQVKIVNFTCIEYTSFDSQYEDEFEYQIYDEWNQTSEQNGKVYIQSTSFPPLAYNDTVKTKWNTSIVIHVLENDISSSTLNLNFLSVPTHGKVEKMGKSIFYTPKDGFVGMDEFWYTCKDNQLESLPAFVQIHVYNAKPLTWPNFYSFYWRIPSFEIPILQNCSDPDGDPLNLVFVNASHGLVKVKCEIGICVMVYERLNFKALEDQIYYTITDWNQNASNFIFIKFENQIPIAKNDSYQIHWNHTGSLIKWNIMDNDIDPDGDPISILSYRWVSFPAGILSGYPTRFYSFGNSSGIQIFEYTLFDGRDSSYGFVHVELTNLNRPGSQNTTLNFHWKDWEHGVSILILKNKDDSDGDQQQVRIFGQTGNWTFSNGIGIYQKSKWKGQEIWIVEISDGQDKKNSTFILNSQNQAPIVPPYKNVSLCGIQIQQGSELTTSFYDLDSQDQVWIANVSLHGNFSWNENQIFYYPQNGISDHGYVSVTDGLESVSFPVFIHVCHMNLSNLWIYDKISWKQASVGWQKLFTNLTRIVDQIPPVGNAMVLSNFTLFLNTTFVGNIMFTLEYVHMLGVPSQILFSLEIYNRPPKMNSLFFSNHWKFWSQPKWLNGVNQIVDEDEPFVKFAPFTWNFTHFQYQNGLPRVGIDSFFIQISDGLENVNRMIHIESTNKHKPQYTDTTLFIPWHKLEKEGILWGIPTYDLDGDEQTLAIQNPTSGTIQLLNSTHWYYHPRTKWVGKDVLGLSVSDGVEKTTFMITIFSTYSPPVCEFHEWTIHRNDSRKGIKLCLNTTKDMDGNSVFIVSVGTSLLSNTISLFNSCLFYQGNHAGTDKVFYSISDGIAPTLCSAQIFVKNQKPIIHPSFYQVLWKNKIQIQMNCIDEDGDSLILNPSLIRYGSCLWNSNGSCYYTPLPSTYAFQNGSRYWNTEILSYSCSDGIFTTFGVLQIEIYNHAPYSPPLEFEWNRNKTHTGKNLPVLNGLDKDKDNDLVWISHAQFQSPSSNHLSIQNLSLFYNPLPTFLGNEKILCTITDGNLHTTFFIQIRVLNALPVCTRNLTSTNFKGQTYKWYPIIESPCIDPNGDTLSISLHIIPEKWIINLGVDKGHFILGTPKKFNSGNEKIVLRIEDGISYSLLFIDTWIINQSPNASQYHLEFQSRAYDCMSPSMLILNDASKKFHLSHDEFLYAGFSLLPNVGSSSSYLVSIEKIHVLFLVSCEKKGGILNFTIDIPNIQYLVPARSIATIPSANDKDDSTFQSGAIPVPDICQGEKIYFSRGAILTANFFSNDLTKIFSFQFHYGKKTDSKWSQIFTIRPNCLVESSSIRKFLISPIMQDETRITLTNPMVPTLPFHSILVYNQTTLQIQILQEKAGIWRFSYQCTDNDIDTPMSSTIAPNTLRGYYLPPKIAKAIFYAVQKEDKFAISLSELLLHGKDPNGFPFILDQILCNQTGRTCLLPYEWSTSNNDLIILNHDKTACGDYEFEYMIRTLETGLSAVGIFVVNFAECECKKPNDIIYVVDGTSIISSSEWKILKEALMDWTGYQDIHKDRVKVSVVQFSSSAVFQKQSSWGCHFYGFPLEYSDVKKKISELDQFVSSTRKTIDGIEAAFSMKTREISQKTIVLITAGAPNSPCSCSGSSNSTFKSCSSCSWNPSKLDYCLPCADITIRSLFIQQQPNWKVVTLGIGNSIPSITQSHLKISASPTLTPSSFFTSWASLKTIRQSILNKIC